MKRFFAVFFASVLVWTPVAAQQAPVGTKVRIATEGAYKPWNFRDTDGALTGFEIDLVRLLCEDLKFDCTLQSETWSRMLPNLDEGKFDAIFAGMSITSARKARARFSTPYAASPAVFVTRSESRKPDTRASDLTLPAMSTFEEAALVAIREAFLNAKIGVQKATTHEIFLRDYIDGYALVRTFESQGDLDAAVAGGELTAMLVSLGYASPLVNSPQGEGLRIVAPRISGGPFGSGIGAAFRKGDAALANAFSAAIVKRRDDGTIRDLALRWFGYDASAKP